MRMEDKSGPVSASFDVEGCIETIEELIDHCDGAGRPLVALHLSQAADLLRAEAGLSKDR